VEQGPCYGSLTEIRSSALANARPSPRSASPRTNSGATAKEHAGYHNVVVWDRLATVCGSYLGKGQQSPSRDGCKTRQWEDDRGVRHWKTEVVATTVEDALRRRYRAYGGVACEQARVDIRRGRCRRQGPATDPPPRNRRRCDRRNHHEDEQTSFCPETFRGSYVGPPQKAAPASFLRRPRTGPTKP